MNRPYYEIDQIIKQDPGKRNIISESTNNPLKQVVSSLLDAKHVLLTTGFFIPEANSIETDGPPGTFFIANALSDLGIRVTILVEEYAKEIFLAASKCYNVNIDYKFINLNKTYSYAELISDDTTHLIALERPGMASDGYYYNQQGNSISHHHFKLDECFTKAQKLGIVTIGIGDGGNELGLGNDYNLFRKSIANGEKIATVTSSDFHIMCGVSNWAGYAIAALLNFEAKNDNFYDETLLDCIMTKIIDNGAVDGVVKKATKTVDGLPYKWELGVLNSINSILKKTVAN